MAESALGSDELHLQVEEFIYQITEENLLALANYLKIATEQFVGKTKKYHLKVIRNDTEGQLEGIEEEGDKIVFLKALLSKIKEKVADETSETADPPKEPEQDPEILSAKKESEEMQAKFQSMIQEQKKAMEAAQSKLEKLTEVKKGNRSKDETASSGSDVKTPPKQPLIDVTKLKDFTIKGQVGNPNQKEKLSYISLMNQTGAGITKGYPEHDIVMAVMESISPELSIRGYLEALQRVT